MNRRIGGWFSVGLGVVLVLVGLGWGLLGSHQIAYESSQTGTTYDVLIGQTYGNIYIHAVGSSEYFVAFKEDFSPALSVDNLDNSDIPNFIARTDTTKIGLKTNGTEITQAHKIEKLFFTDRSGNTVANFTTAEYLNNPNGIYISVWSQAVWVLVLGLFFAGYGLFDARRKQNTGFRIGNGPVPAMPHVPPQPVYPPAQPADQAYRGPDPYAQQGQNPYQQPPRG